MKKLLVILIALLLIVASFILGSTFSLVNDVTDDTMVSYTEYSELYESQGFEKIGKNFNTILKIKDFYIGDVSGENYIVVDNNISDIGYYFEYPYAAFIDIWSESNTLRHSSEVYVIKDYSSENLFEFEFIDNFTLMVKPNNMNEYIVVDDVIMTNENGAIFKGHIDCYGFDVDEQDLYFFATEFEKMVELETYEIGEPVYLYGSIFAGYDNREIYF